MENHLFIIVPIIKEDLKSDQPWPSGGDGDILTVSEEDIEKSVKEMGLMGIYVQSTSANNRL